MGDFNGKAGNNKEESTVGPFGLEIRNENGARVVNYWKRYHLFITNTWYQQKRSSQYRWISSDKQTKNQIDYVLVDKRFRNGIQNSNSMPGADCESVTLIMHLNVPVVYYCMFECGVNTSNCLVKMLCYCYFV